jgi:multicomponent Na+:H+ antiporter subunit E
MRSLRLFIMPSFIMTIIWCVLNERFDLTMVITGILISAFVVIIQRYIFDLSHEQRYSIAMTPLTFLKYFGVLFYSIIKSSFETIKYIFKGTHNAGFVKTHVEHKNKYHQMFVANSITLTPGTVTVDVENDEILILWIDKKTDDPEEARELIHKKFDDILG